MGQILTVATSRGGAGKTVLSALLAANLAKLGYRVAVVDADPNQTFSTLVRSGYRGPKFDLLTETRHEEIVEVAQDQADAHHICLVDTAGFGNQTANFAMSMSDMVLIPCMPDRGSVVEANKTAKLVASFAKAGRREILFRVVRTRWVPTRIGPREALRDLEDLKLPVLTRYVPAMSRFDNMFFDGDVPTGGTAGFEVGRMIDELIELGAIPAQIEHEVA
jgi:chromosome partitioning protein